MTFIHCGPNFWPLVYTSALKFSNPLIHPRTYCSDIIFSYLYFEILLLLWNGNLKHVLQLKPNHDHLPVSVFNIVMFLVLVSILLRYRQIHQQTHRCETCWTSRSTTVHTQSVNKWGMIIQGLAVYRKTINEVTVLWSWVTVTALKWTAVWQWSEFIWLTIITLYFLSSYGYIWRCGTSARIARSCYVRAAMNTRSIASFLPSTEANRGRKTSACHVTEKPQRVNSDTGDSFRRR